MISPAEAKELTFSPAIEAIPTNMNLYGPIYIYVFFLSGETYEKMVLPVLSPDPNTDVTSARKQNKGKDAC